MNNNTMEQLNTLEQMNTLEQIETRKQEQLTCMVSDEQLSEHFRLSEFTHSITAQRLGLKNEPDYQQRLALRHLCQEVLEPLRRHWGHPIRVTSGFRSIRLNHAVGGVGQSQHLLGEAADLSVPSEQVAREWFEWIVRHTDFDQLLFEHSASMKNRWLHVSCRWQREKNRHLALFNYEAR
jgi:uncharacterized protein YcbK (DUF882 family)